MQVMIYHTHVDYKDNENCDDNDIFSIGWIKSPEDTESFKLSINAPSAKVVIVTDENAFVSHDQTDSNMTRCITEGQECFATLILPSSHEDPMEVFITYFF